MKKCLTQGVYRIFLADGKEVEQGPFNASTGYAPDWLMKPGDPTIVGAFGQAYFRRGKADGEITNYAEDVARQAALMTCAHSQGWN
jgi:hypothetical protein